MAGKLTGRKVLVTQADDYMGPQSVETFRQAGAEVIDDRTDLTEPGAAGRVVAGCLADPGFLEANGMRPTDAAAVAGHARLEALHEARTVAAMTLWHHDLAGGADPGEAWVARAPVPPDADDASALPDRLDAIYALDSLQMCLLGAATEHRLFTDHGERWWWSPDAGAALRAMWSEGQRKSAEEHVGELVNGGLAAAAALL